MWRPNNSQGWCSRRTRQAPRRRDWRRCATCIHQPAYCCCKTHTCAHWSSTRALCSHRRPPRRLHWRIRPLSHTCLCTLRPEIRSPHSRNTAPNTPPCSTFLPRLHKIRWRTRCRRCTRHPWRSCRLQRDKRGSCRTLRRPACRSPPQSRWSLPVGLARICSSPRRARWHTLPPRCWLTDSRQSRTLARAH